MRSYLRLHFIFSGVPQPLSRARIFYALLCALYFTKVAVIVISHLAYDPAHYATPILSAGDYMSVAAGYLRLAQHTVENSQSQRRLVYAVYGMFGFSGLLLTIAAIGVLCRAWALSQETQMLLTIALSVRHGLRVPRYPEMDAAGSFPASPPIGRANRTRNSDDYHTILADLR